jgi:RNA polymerase-interacting CarD/CdnL/TRCF family regulator
MLDVKRYRTINIRQGEHVHHPQHGIGKVQSIRKRSFYGHEPARYAQLYFERDALTLTLLEKDLSETIRCLITAVEAKELLQKIEAWDGKPKAQWKARADAHQAAIDGGDPFECGKVLKGLSQMEAEGTLRPRDRAHLNRSQELLTEELSRALKKSRAQVLKLIDEAIGA